MYLFLVAGHQRQTSPKSFTLPCICVFDCLDVTGCLVFLKYSDFFLECVEEKCANPSFHLQGVVVYESFGVLEELPEGSDGCVVLSQQDSGFLSLTQTRSCTLFVYSYFSIVLSYSAKCRKILLSR